MMRKDGRSLDELRPVKIIRDFVAAPEASVLIEMGDTKVICAISLEENRPRWMREQNIDSGWITAEYSLLPFSSSRRTRRESAMGRIGGRTYEIQRLIGRSLRTVVDLHSLGHRTLWVDCDVIQADGGTRMAAVTGGFTALYLALLRLKERGVISSMPVREYVAGVSVGIVDDVPVIDLSYEEDSRASVDMNVVLTEGGKFIEIQGTGEKKTFSEEELGKMLDLCREGAAELIQHQKRVIEGDG
ncbi:MAG: ribonuclease PH [Candidatus Tritonobacter lacicola]|nr:ribonuclease PH [Candidatus Tritonobacter lacicola]